MHTASSTVGPQAGRRVLDGVTPYHWLVVIIAASLVGGLVGMIGGAGSVGKMLGGLVEAGFGLVATMISIAISAAAYRQLATTQAGDIFA